MLLMTLETLAIILTIFIFNTIQIYLFGTVMKIINKIPFIAKCIVFLFLKISIKFKIHIGLGFNTNWLHVAKEIAYLFVVYSMQMYLLFKFLLLYYFFKI